MIHTSKPLTSKRLGRWLGALSALAVLTAAGCQTTTHKTSDSFEPRWDKLVVNVKSFEDRQPTGVAVSKTGRTFVCFPYWKDQPMPAVAEITSEGDLRPYPSGSWNAWDGRGGASALRGVVCAQALHIDENNHLWILDAGNPKNRRGVVVAGPKLFRIDLADDSIVQVFYFDHKRDFTTESYLSDFVVDPATSTAFISDSARGAIYVVDLKTRDVQPRLLEHMSTKPEPGVVAQVGDRPWTGRLGQPQHEGVSGMALSPDRKWLYYQALTGRTLYRVPVEALSNEKFTDVTVAGLVETVADTGSVVDGMHMADDGTLYLTALEQDAILVLRPGQAIQTFIADERLRWPDSLAMGPEGYLYFTASRRHLAAHQAAGPYQLMRASIANVTKAVEAEAQAKRAAARLAEVRRSARDAELRAQAEKAERDRIAAQAAHQQEMARLAALRLDEAHARKQQAAARMQASSKADDLAALKQQTAAAAARLRAAESKRAALAAAEAARLAQAAVLEAEQEANRLRAALTAHELTAAERQSTEAALAVAKAEADAASGVALAAMQRSQREAASAAQAAQLAQVASDRAQLRASEAQQMLREADRAAQVAAEALAAAKAAEYAELKPPVSEPSEIDTQTAEVPTD